MVLERPDPAQGARAEAERAPAVDEGVAVTCSGEPDEDAEGGAAVLYAWPCAVGGADLEGCPRLLERAGEASRGALPPDPHPRLLAEWAEPDGQDRVLGEWRALPHRNTLVARSAGRAHVGSLLAAGTPGRVVRAACVAADRLGLPDMSAILAQAAQEAGHDGETRARALITLENLGALGDTETVARGVGSGEPLPLRRAASLLLSSLLAAAPAAA